MTGSVAGRRVAVVGGTGFIGSHLVERLVADGADVLVVARGTERLAQLAAVRAHFACTTLDICERDEVLRAFRLFRPEIVFHMAAHPDAAESFTHFADCLRVNGIGLVNVLHAAAVSGAGVLVYGDSAKVYGNSGVPYRVEQPEKPICSYAIVKSAAWQLCTLAASFSPLNVVALRPTFIYGPRQSRNVITYVRECVDASRPVRLQGGSQTRDPLFIGDAVGAFVKAALSPAAYGHAIPIGGGHELTVAELCEAVLAAMSATLPVASGAEEPRLTEIWRSSVDNSDALRLLGWQPRVSLAEGLARTVADWVQPAASSAIAEPMNGRVSVTAAHYLSEIAPGLAFAMLDRRTSSRADRRPAVPARRASDHPSRAAALAHVGPAFHSLPAAITGAGAPTGDLT